MALSFFLENLLEGPQGWKCAAKWTRHFVPRGCAFNPVPSRFACFLKSSAKCGRWTELFDLSVIPPGKWTFA
jgi:hypothetical protein